MRRSCLFLLLLVAIWPQSLQAEGKRYALVIGVKSYRPGQPLPDLAFTENDANELAKVLTVGGYQVTLMTQTVGRNEGKEVYAPLSDYIRDQLDAMLGNPFLKQEDIVLIALAGHGVQYDHVDGEKKTTKYFFCPADADIAKVTSANDITDRSRVLDLQELYTALSTCKAGGKLLLVDACRNDPTKPSVSRSLASATLPPLPPPPGGTAAFFSCSANQRALECQKLKHGVFFHHVIEALRGDADAGTAKRPADGKVTLAELSEHVSVSTYDYVRLQFRGSKQAPELKGEFRLSIPIIDVTKGTTELLPFDATQPRTAEEAKSVQAAWAQHLGKMVVERNSVGMELVLIPPGQFKMGSPANEADRVEDEGQVTVRLTQPWYVGKTEVTQQQWFAVMGTRPWMGKDNVKDGDDYPATWLSAEQADQFCEKLSQKEGVTYRLLTEAEWEYACRAGSQTRFHFGDDPDLLKDFAWYAGKVKQETEASPHPVAAKSANAFGLHDLHGNVWEWCSDWYVDQLAGGENPQVTTDNGTRVYRSSSYDSESPSDSRSAFRGGISPGIRYSWLGFRVARVNLTN